MVCYGACVIAELYLAAQVANDLVVDTERGGTIQINVSMRTHSHTNKSINKCSNCVGFPDPSYAGLLA